MIEMAEYVEAALCIQMLDNHPGGLLNFEEQVSICWNLVAFFMYNSLLAVTLCLQVERPILV